MKSLGKQRLQLHVFQRLQLHARKISIDSCNTLVMLVSRGIQVPSHLPAYPVSVRSKFVKKEDTRWINLLIKVISHNFDKARNCRKFQHKGECVDLRWLQVMN